MISDKSAVTECYINETLKLLGFMQITVGNITWVSDMPLHLIKCNQAIAHAYSKVFHEYNGHISVILLMSMPNGSSEVSCKLQSGTVLEQVTCPCT